jgi:hypothetical protein
MAGNLFDVFVVGATDPSQAGETRLAAALSAKHGVPLATIAKAISAKNLRAGQSLDQAQAQALVRHLQSIGAVTVIRPVAGSKPGGGPSPSQVAHPVAAPPAGGPSRSSGVMPAAGGGWPGPPAGPAGGGVDPFAPLGPGPQAAVGPAGVPDPFLPASGMATSHAAPPRPRMASPTPGVAPTRAPGSGIAIEVSPGPKLELARADRNTSEEELVPARGRPTGSAASLREMGMTGSSGVAMDEDPKNLNLVRCVQHGLYYDKTKASGCRKCLSSAREVVVKMNSEAAPFRVGDLRNKPAKRAFIGLAFALVLGFLPAVYYCFGPGAAEVRKVRVEQELLSRQPGTEEVLKRFDQLEGQVGDLHDQATRNTGIVWFVVTAVGMLGWYKIT